MMNINTQTRKQNQNKINPIIENLLKDPISFQSARYPDKISIKPSSYIIFKSFKDNKNSKTIDINKDIDLNSNSNTIKQEMVRPKSMAEAVANYTGKKYLSKKERKEEKRKIQLEKKQEKEKSNESQINNDSITSNNEETSSILSDNEFQGEKLENKNQAEEKNNNDNNEFGEINVNVDGNDGDEEEEDDDDNYHTADENEESQTSLNEDSGNESNREDGSENSSGPSEIEMELETEADILKKDLKEDNLSKKLLSMDESKPTLASSLKEEEQSEKNESPIEDNSNESKLIQGKFNSKDFYDLNENPNNSGSNNSKRILKSWGDFTKSHNALGLLNHGVTCYMNSAVQAMCHIPSLTRYLIEVHNGQHQKEISPDSVTQILADTVAKMYKVENKRKIVYINPKKLCKRLADINCMMSEWQQEDSHEYFMSLISRLQEDSTPKGVKLNQSIIYDIFGGLLNQTVTCKNCGHISTTEQEFYDLSLGLDNRKKRSSLMIDPNQLYQLKEQIESCKSSSKDSKIQLSELLNQRILLAQEEIKSRSQTPETNESQSIQQKNPDPNSSKNDANSNNDIGNSQSQSDEPSAHTYSIENSIKDFFTPEIIKTDKRDQSGYVCEKCKIKTNAIKISTISRSPETLSIHLKRFRFNGQQSQKVKANVTYPEILDLTEYTTSMDSPTRYKLISVIVHQGRSVSSGHYIAHCRQPDGCWETYDDEYVNKIKSRDALSDPSAYVLIYERLTYKNTANNDNIGNKRKNAGADDAESNDYSTKKRKTRKKNS